MTNSPSPDQLFLLEHGISAASGQYPNVKPCKHGILVSPCRECLVDIAQTTADKKREAKIIGAGMYQGEIIPQSRKMSDATCEFCDGFKHFGWCDQMREHSERQAARGEPRVVPHTRAGP